MNEGLDDRRDQFTGELRDIGKGNIGRKKQWAAEEICRKQSESGKKRGNWKKKVGSTVRRNLNTIGQKGDISYFFGGKHRGE